jgi:hypothetical protein
MNEAHDPNRTVDVPSGPADVALLKKAGEQTK